MNIIISFLVQATNLVKCLVIDHNAPLPHFNLVSGIFYKLKSHLLPLS